MKISVNGQGKDVAEGASVAALLADLGLADLRVAVAVNRDVVPRAEHACRRLAAGDRVEIVRAVQGG